MCKIAKYNTKQNTKESHLARSGLKSGPVGTTVEMVEQHALLNQSSQYHVNDSGSPKKTNVFFKV